MGYLLNSKEVGHIGVKQLREQRELISNRWSKLGLLEGLEGSVKENIALLYENELSHLRESTSADGNGTGSFEMVAFPIVRRIFSKLLANELVSVQALNLPVGKLFFMNPRISVRKADGSHYSPDGSYQNAAGQTDAPGANQRVQFDQTKSLYDQGYATEYDNEGESLFDRSKGSLTKQTGAATLLTSIGTVGSVALPASVKVEVSGISAGDEGKLIVGATGIEMDTETFLSSLEITNSQPLAASAGFEEYNKAAGTKLRYRVVTQAHGEGIVKDGKILLEVYLTYPGEDGYQPYSYEAGGASETPMVFNFSYSKYNNMEEDSEMGEVTFDLTSVTVSVVTRKLRATWTPEFAQDIYAFHSIDAEAELTTLLSEQVAAEIDREILRDLRRGAAWVDFWDYNGLRKQTTAFYGVQKDWNQTLITAINRVSNQIHKSTLRGGANWIVVSPEVSSVFDDLEYFHVSNAAPEQDKYNMGMERVGSLSNRYTVYRDPYAPAGTILIGHKGSSILETGYVYAPYVPLQLTPVMYNHNDFKPVRGIMTRYAKKMVNNKFYGKIIVDGLKTFPLNELR